MKRKKIVLFVFLLVGILITIIIYNDKKNTLNNDKLIIKKSYAIMIKGDGETDYTNANSIPSDLTNYHIDTDKTFCENGGTVDIVGNKLSYQTLGSDRCTIYMYYDKPHDIKINVSTPTYLLSGYTKSITNCTGTNNAVWDNKLNGLVISNWSDLVKCDISFTQKTPSSSELLTTIVDTNGTSTTHGIRYQGKNPDNYVWYNEELWRIIGNVPVCLTSGCASTENRVKLIRNDSIGAIVFNQTDFSSSSPLTWMGSNVQNLLNTCYLGKTSSCDDYCYSYGSSAAGTCDYSSVGINASDYYGNMIEDVYYNVGAGDGIDKTADDYYTQEIASYASATSKIGLIYASDWGYAIEGFSGVLEQSGNPQSYMNKNWLFSNGYEWTMSAYDSLNILFSHYDGILYEVPASNGYIARPVLYLKSNVYVTGGTGTKTNPYTLGI